jgi:isopentenyl diphosphate isomerase/L-lactate dehydrogenase-like FMN-dependent dehydrogenase
MHCPGSPIWPVLAGDFLRAADKNGVEGVVELAETITDELRVAMFCAGVPNLAALTHTHLIKS